MTKSTSTSSTASDAHELWNSKRTASFLGLSVAWLEKDRMSGRPKIPYIKIGRAVRYVPDQVIMAAKSLSVGGAD